MIQRIRSHVNELFRDAPATRQAHELKEEVCSNLIDKYVDLTGQGMSEEEAYSIAVAGIGDIDALLAELQQDGPTEEQAGYRCGSALMVTGAVGLYSLSVVATIVVGESGSEGDEVKALAVMFVLCAVATMMLIYNFMTKPKYRRTDDTMVEEFREWKQNKSKGDALYNSLSGALWAFIVLLYFVVSILFTAWTYSWLIFLVGVALQQVLRAVYLLKKK